MIPSPYSSIQVCFTALIYMALGFIWRHRWLWASLLLLVILKFGGEWFSLGSSGWLPFFTCGMIGATLAALAVWHFERDRSEIEI